MGVRPVTSSLFDSAGGPSSWKLADDIAKDVQGLVVSGFSGLPQARAFFLDATKAPGGAWLEALRKVAPITPADGPRQPAAIIAFTATGLTQIGIGDALASFQTPFAEGMLQKDRRRRLGDDDSNGSTSTISHGGLAWGGTAAGPDDRGWSVVHALLMLYEADAAAIADHARRVIEVLAGHQVVIAREMELDLRLDGRGIGHEHFGFADGISQPVPFDAQAVIGPRDAIHGVPLGDILLGYRNSHGEIPPGPVVAHAIAVDTTVLRAKGVAPAAAPVDAQRSVQPLALKAVEDTAGLYDLGLNGSYLVVRELKQDVAAFWSSLDKAAADLNRRAGDTAVTADWLADRVVGRNKDGHLLGPTGPCRALADDMPDNAQLYFKTDRQGFGCPIGAHVRRANPRDGLAGQPADCGGLLDAANAHRILRRGRKFGEPAPEDRSLVDGKDRGLLFMCLNTDLVRQFEFVQQNWILNPNFGTLYKEVDPLIGPRGKMTLPKEPLRRIVEVETYVTLTGGDYFFLPSLRALDYFQTLKGPEVKQA